MLEDERHKEVVPSLKRPLRLGLIFTQVGGPAATKRGDPANELLSRNGFTLAVQVSRVSGEYLSFMEAFQFLCQAYNW